MIAQSEGGSLRIFRESSLSPHKMWKIGYVNHAMDKLLNLNGIVIQAVNIKYTNYILGSMSHDVIKIDTVPEQKVWLDSLSCQI